MTIAYTVDIAGPGAVQFCDQLVVSMYSVRKNMGPDDEIDAYVFYDNLPSVMMEKANGLATDRFRIRFRTLHPTPTSMGVFISLRE